MREILFRDSYGATLEIRSHLISDGLLVIYTKGAVELDIDQLAMVVKKLERRLKHK